MSKVEIEHQCTFTIEKVKKIRDRRFKSGYRSIETLSFSQPYLHLYSNPMGKNIQTTVPLQHLDERTDGFYLTTAVADITIYLSESEEKVEPTNPNKRKEDV